MSVVADTINYPVHVCTAGLCIWSRWFVYVYMWPKNCLFELLLLENLLLVLPEIIHTT